MKKLKRGLKEIFMTMVISMLELARHNKCSPKREVVAINTVIKTAVEKFNKILGHSKI